MDEIRETLKKYWGFENFRPCQEAIVKQVLNKRDALALLPTGGGKSICYQLPAVTQPGIALVISPLLSLMKDQVNRLTELGIKATYIPGGTSLQEVDTILDNCIYGNYKLLYLSPERAQQELVVERIKKMDVSLLAVDEAHCISQWGHDFRQAYRQIKELREHIPEVPCLALTATATPKVVGDIQEQLGLPKEAIFQTSFKRENLSYVVRTTEDKVYDLIQILKHRKESSIIYVRSRKTAKHYAELLNTNGIPAHFYHGGLNLSQRDKFQKDWMDEKVRAMVATNAFGMGIDKGNVGTVVHVELPESLESYFQEAGRAGRNGKPAVSVILFHPSDQDRLQNQFISVLPDASAVKLIYKKLVSYFRISFGEGQEEYFPFNFSEFCKTYGLNTLLAYNTLTILDRTGVLTLSQEFKSTTSLKLETTPLQLTHYLIRNAALDGAVKTILRTYSGIFDEEVQIDLATISRKSNIAIAKIHETLLQLDREELATYTYTSYDSGVLFLVPREDEHTWNPVLPYVKQQRKQKITQVKSVLYFVKQQEHCRSTLLLRYFGESQKEPCGICDICKKTQNRSGSSSKKKSYKAQILEAVAEAPKNSRELENALKLPKEVLLANLKELLVEEKIKLNPSNRFQKP
ncbi:MAG: ATP-dependent DNA helicase RecQ [Leeuwenhoekiella sp.]